MSPIDPFHEAQVSASARLRAPGVCLRCPTHTTNVYQGLFCAAAHDLRGLFPLRPGFLFRGAARNAVINTMSTEWFLLTARLRGAEIDPAVCFKILIIFLDICQVDVDHKIP